MSDRDEEAEEAYNNFPTHSYIRKFLKTPNMELIKLGLEPWISQIREDEPGKLPLPEFITPQYIHKLMTGKITSYIPYDSRRGAYTKEIEVITLMGLQIWLPDYVWEVKEIQGTNIITSDISNLGNNLGGCCTGAPFIIIINYWMGTERAHAVIGFVMDNNSNIGFKNSHGEVLPTIFNPNCHFRPPQQTDSFSQPDPQYSFLIFEPRDANPIEGFWEPKNDEDLDVEDNVSGDEEDFKEEEGFYTKSNDPPIPEIKEDFMLNIFEEEDDFIAFGRDLALKDETAQLHLRPNKGEGDNEDGGNSKGPMRIRSMPKGPRRASTPYTNPKPRSGQKLRPKSAR